jgi:hypothetical protein
VRIKGLNYIIPKKSMWTLASALHIRTAVPSWANLARENKNGQESQEDAEEVEEAATDQAAACCEVKVSKARFRWQQRGFARRAL